MCGVCRPLRGGGVGPSPPSPGARTAKGQRGHARLPGLPEVCRLHPQRRPGEGRLQCLGGSGEVGGPAASPPPARFCAEACATLAPPGGAAQNCSHLSVPGTAPSDRHLEPPPPPTPWGREILNKDSSPWRGGSPLCPARPGVPGAPIVPGRSPPFAGSEDPRCALPQAGPKAEPWALGWPAARGDLHPSCSVGP